MKWHHWIYWQKVHKEQKAHKELYTGWSSNSMCMGESSKFPKSWTLEIQILKLVEQLQKWIISSLNDWLCFDNLKNNQRSYFYLPNSAFWGYVKSASKSWIQD